MKSINKVWIAFIFFVVAAPAWATVDLTQVEKALMTTGVSGWVHGSVPDSGLFVFTYRDQGDFFSHYEFPLVLKTPEMSEAFKKLNRHDLVLLKGEFLDDGPPQTHIIVKSVDLQKPYSDGLSYPPYTYSSAPAQELTQKTEMIAKVHAVAAGGKALVVEYKDLIVPVFVKDPHFTQTLMRGDKVRIQYVLRQDPGSPQHMSPNPGVAEPIQMVDAIKDIHGKQITREGILTLFPKSPQIIFDVYALQWVDQNGIGLEYTLVNFDNPATFDQIRAKLKAAWDANAATAVRGRNKLINPKIRIRATGTGNLQDPNQANPQILLSSPDQVVILN